MMNNGKNTNNTSALTRVASAAIPKEANVIHLFGLKNKARETATRKMYNGSVNPRKEFWIILGSKTNTAAPNIGKGISKNRLHKKYTGIMVNKEIDTATARCSVM